MAFQGLCVAPGNQELLYDLAARPFLGVAFALRCFLTGAGTPGCVMMLAPLIQLSSPKTAFRRDGFTGAFALTLNRIENNGRRRC